MLGEFTTAILLSALFAGIAVPLLQGRIAPNPIYGFRVPKTMRDRRIWYLANAYSARQMIVASGIMAAVAVVLLLVPGMTAERYMEWFVAAMMVSLAWVLVLSFRYLSRL